MKIQLKAALQGPESTIPAGTSVEVDNEFGKNLVDGGFAIAIETDDSVIDLRSGKRSSKRAEPKANATQVDGGSAGGTSEAEKSSDKEDPAAST